MTQMSEPREIESIRKVVAPWIEANPLDYQPWQVLLNSGAEITIWCPLGAAVELESTRYANRITARSY